MKKSSYLILSALALATLMTSSIGMVYAKAKIDLDKEATLIAGSGFSSASLDALLKYDGVKKNTKAMTDNMNLYSNKIKAASPKEPIANIYAINNFITYGTPSTAKFPDINRVLMLSVYFSKNKNKIPLNKSDWKNLLNLSTDPVFIKLASYSGGLLPTLPKQSDAVKSCMKVRLTSKGNTKFPLTDAEVNKLFSGNFSKSDTENYCGNVYNSYDAVSMEQISKALLNNIPGSENMSTKEKFITYCANTSFSGIISDPLQACQYNPYMDQQAEQRDHLKKISSQIGFGHKNNCYLNNTDITESICPTKHFAPGICNAASSTLFSYPKISKEIAAAGLISGVNYGKNSPAGIGAAYCSQSNDDLGWAIIVPMTSETTSQNKTAACIDSFGGSNTYYYKIGDNLANFITKDRCKTNEMLVSPTSTAGRDVQRRNDIKKIQMALAQYYAEKNNTYPPTAILTASTSLSSVGFSTKSSGKVYLDKVPVSPSPWNEGGCPNQNYTYTSTGTSSYIMTNCLGSKGQPYTVHNQPMGFVFD